MSQAVSCYTSSLGNIVGVPDPLALPSLSTSTGSGTLGAATYYVVYTYAGAGGQSVASPEQAIVLSGTGTVFTNSPGLQPGNATGFYKVYMSTRAPSVPAASERFARSRFHARRGMKPPPHSSLLCKGIVPPSMYGGLPETQFPEAT